MIVISVSSVQTMALRYRSVLIMPAYSAPYCLTSMIFVNLISEITGFKDPTRVSSDVGPLSRNGVC